MNNIYSFKEVAAEMEQLKHPKDQTKFDGGSGGGYDDRMESRIAKLEEFATDAKERLVKIETRLEETATKADLHALHLEIQKGHTDTIKWVVGTAVVLGGMAITIMTFVLNNAVPKVSTPAASQPAPIVIQLPVQAAASSPPTLQAPKQP